MPNDAVSRSGSGRIRLYAKPSRSDRAIVITVTVVTVLVVIIGIAALSAAAYSVLLVIFACLFAATVFPVGLRTGAWLDGTTLLVRGGYTSRRGDLARGPVGLTTDPASRLPVLTAQDASGQPVQVLLRDPRRRAPLPPPVLHALANAIMAAGRQDPAGREAAGNLIALAGGPPVIPPRR